MKNKEKLVEAIKSDCLRRYGYINHCGETCAIGQLALVASVPKGILEDAEDRRIDAPQPCPAGDEHKDKAVSQMRESIVAMFELTTEQLGVIQRKNDLHLTPEDRRGSILDYLETL